VDRLQTILKRAVDGHRLTEEEARILFSVKERKVWDVAIAADQVRQQKAGDIVTYVKNQNINVTNMCVNACGFCGYSKKPGDEGTYYYTKEEVQEKVKLAKGRDVTEICTVSGLHPDFDAESYADIYHWIHEIFPEVHIHASNPMEVAYAAKKSGITTQEVLVDEVRSTICPQKIRTDEWARIIKEAHRMGIPSTATIMYGHCESDEDKVRHLGILRSIQDETRGFTEFVPLSFIHMNTPIYKKGIARAGATGREDLLMVAVARLFLDNFRNIQVSWVKEGVKMAQVSLIAGANDLGGTMFEESISKGAGAVNTDYLDPAEMRRIAEDAGRTLRQRTTLYALI